MNVRDPAAIAAAGFGDPNQTFNPEEELADVEMDATIVSGFNRQNNVDPKVPVTAQKGKKEPRVVAPKAHAPMPQPTQSPQPEPPKEAEASKEPDEGLELSDDPAERLKQVSAALKEINPQAPTPEQLANWKNMHGDIFVLYLFDQAFVYRYLKRAEWIKMNLDESFQNMRQDQIEEYIFDRCVLWPSFSVIEKAKLPAGTIPSISEQIRMNSMFVDPNRLSQLTVKL
jgi:hypothetical protein